MDIKPVQFQAELRQIKSMADRTYNVILNVPEYDIDKVRKMLGWITDLVEVVIIQVDTKDDQE